MKNILTENIHIPVMLKEVLEILSPEKGDFIIDGTLGGGGHARRIADLISPEGTLLGIDRDPRVIENIKTNAFAAKTIFINANFSDLPKIIQEQKLSLADGLILDLGFSSNQLCENRGFSFLKDEPLFMTYNDKDEPLYQALKRFTKEEIRDIIALSGERYAKVLANNIWKEERKKPIKTTGELVKIIRLSLPVNYERKRIHPATRTFLAFRMHINKELDSLEKIIDSLPQVIKPGGRVVIITFQSLEDKIIKNKFKELAKKGLASLINKKPIIPQFEEIKTNPRARSAKLRALKIN